MARLALKAFALLCTLILLIVVATPMAMYWLDLPFFTVSSMLVMLFHMAVLWAVLWLLYSIARHPFS